MTKKQLFIELTKNSMPKGEVREEMFKLHNSLVGTNVYIRRTENPKTACGTCIQRVKVNLWKWYHYASGLSYKGLVFTGKLGIYNVPVYLYEDGK